jgi:hypothetical protein
MKKLFGFLTLSIFVLILAGCSTCRPCEKKAETVPVVAPAAVVYEPAPVAPAALTESADESIPAATRRYVSK